MNIRLPVARLLILLMHAMCDLCTDKTIEL
jgi:hypothetical protein